MKTKIYLILMLLFISCDVSKSDTSKELRKSSNDLYMTVFECGYQRGVLNYMRNGKFDTTMYKSDSLIIDLIIRRKK